MDRLSEIRARCDAAKEEKRKGNALDCACLSWAVVLNDVPYLLAEIEQANEIHKREIIITGEYAQRVIDLTARAEKAEAEIKSIHEALCFADKCRSTCTNYTELAVSNGLALGKIAVAIQHDYDAEPPKGA